MMRVFSAFAVATFLFVSSSSAQIVYEPVQYQYGGQNSYYYGGSNPHMHRYAQSTHSEGRTWGRVNGFEFVSANVNTHREVSGNGAPRVFSDALGFREAHFYGYTPDDARNDANAAAPTYFRKADVLRTAIREADGTWTVPAAPIAGGVRIYNVRPSARVEPARESLGAPRPLLIIPKNQLDKPLAAPGKIADAR